MAGSLLLLLDIVFIYSGGLPLSGYVVAWEANEGGEGWLSGREKEREMRGGEEGEAPP